MWEVRKRNLDREKKIQHYLQLLKMNFQLLFTYVFQIIMYCFIYGFNRNF